MFILDIYIKIMGLLGNPNFDDPEENAKFDEIMEAWRQRQFFDYH